MVLTYKVQGKPRLTEIKFQGNTKFKTREAAQEDFLQSRRSRWMNESSSPIRRTSRNCTRKPATRTRKVKYVLNIDENAGRGTATFQITESPKVKILEVDFVGAQAFTGKEAP